MVALDPSKAITNKIPTPPPKTHTAISMLDGKNRISEFKNPTLYKDDGKLKALKSYLQVLALTMFIQRRTNALLSKHLPPMFAMLESSSVDDGLASLKELSGSSRKESFRLEELLLVEQGISI